jgi:hypothetical protein
MQQQTDTKENRILNTTMTLKGRGLNNTSFYNNDNSLVNYGGLQTGSSNTPMKLN